MFTSVTVALISLTVAVTVMLRHRWQGSRPIVVLMLLAGFGITSGGFVADGLTSFGTWLGSAFENGTAAAFGTGAPVVLLAFMVTLIVVDMKDRNIWKPTPWVALALPAFLAIVGGVSLSYGNMALQFIGNLLTSLVGWLG